MSHRRAVPLPLSTPSLSRSPRPGLMQRLVARLPAPRASTAARVTCLDLELSDPPTPAPAGSTHVHVVVRLHGLPIGDVRLDLTTHGSDQELWSRARAAVEAGLVRHLADDGIGDPSDLPPDGRQHRCLQRLEPGPNAPRVSVIVPTHNRAGVLVDCLRSLQACTYPDFEVLVVDNGAEDSTTRSLVTQSFADDARIRYLEIPSPGASLARNAGARQATGDLLAFTDDDAVVDPLWLRALVAPFVADPTAVCVSGLTLPSDLSTPAQLDFEAYGGMALGYEAKVYHLAERPTEVRLYPYSAGIFGASNNVAFRKDDLLALGGFDEHLGPGTAAFGAEDLDLFLAAIRTGRRIVYEPSAVVRHAHRATYQDLYWQVFTYSAGFTAYLTKWAVRDRRVRRELLGRVPGLLPSALLDRQRGPAATDGPEYPPTLRWLERAGYLYGPVAYARSRWRSRRRLRRSGRDLAS